MAVRKPRVGEDSKICRETVLDERRWARRSGRENLLAFVRSMLRGRLAGRRRRVSVIQAMRSRVHRMEPARALMTS
jgi:hypothetical protein